MEITQEEIVRLAERLDGAVVAIGRGGRGAGLVIGDDRVLTAAHNLRDRTTSVQFAGGRVEQAEVTAADADGDLVVLQVATQGAEGPAWTATDAGLGAPVLALARPGGRGLRATVGRVSGVDQSLRGPRGARITGALEHTAPLGRGSTGGPLVDADGRLVAMNLARVGDGFTLALPATEGLRTRTEALGRGETPQRRRLGVGLAPPEVADRLRRSVGLPERGGLLVRQVGDDTPAARAGLQVGDLLLRVAGRELSSVDALVEALAIEQTEVVIEVLRGTEEQELSVSFTTEQPGPVE